MCIKEPEKALTNIRLTTEHLLPDGVVVADNVYRPFDRDIFGKEGFSLVLYQAPNRMFGINFGKNEPNKERIEAGVNHMLEVFKERM